MNTAKMVLVGVAVGVGFAGVATVLAPLVHADEGTYVESVAQHGTLVTQYTLPLGHSICARISADGPAGVDEVAQAAHSVDITAHDFGVLVESAVYELCPSNVPALKAWLDTPVGAA